MVLLIDVIDKCEFVIRQMTVEENKRIVLQ